MEGLLSMVSSLKCFFHFCEGSVKYFRESVLSHLERINTETYLGERLLIKTAGITFLLFPLQASWNATLIGREENTEEGAGM